MFQLCPMDQCFQNFDRDVTVRSKVYIMSQYSHILTVHKINTEVSKNNTLTYYMLYALIPPISVLLFNASIEPPS